MERIKKPEDSALWYTIKLLVRDKERFYNLQAECISTNLESGASCGNLSVPHAGYVTNVTFYDGFMVQFGDDKLFYEVSGEESPDYKREAN